MATEQTATTSDMTDMEAMLRQAAQDADSGKAVDLSALSASATQETGGKTETTAEGTTPDASSTALNPGAEKQTDTAKPQGEDGKSKQPDNKTGDQQQSNFAKNKAERERKEQERFDRNWKKLEERNAEIAERERRLAERERSLETGQHRQSSTTRSDATTSEEYTPEQWDRAADTWQKQGKFDLADAAREKAEELRRNPPQRSQERRSESRAITSNEPPEETPGTPQFTAKWQENLTQLTAEHPELKDPKSELYQATAKVLESDKRFSRFNDGIRAAFEIANLQLQANRVPTLEAKVKEQSEELAKLRAATQPGAGTTETALKEKSFEEMSSAEQEAYLQQRAAQEA